MAMAPLYLVAAAKPATTAPHQAQRRPSPASTRRDIQVTTATRNVMGTSFTPKCESRPCKKLKPTSNSAASPARSPARRLAAAATTKAVAAPSSAARMRDSRYSPPWLIQRRVDGSPHTTARTWLTPNKA